MQMFLRYRGGPLEFPHNFCCGKLDLIGYQVVKKRFLIYFVVLIQYTLVTDRRTDTMMAKIAPITIASHSKNGIHVPE